MLGGLDGRAGKASTLTRLDTLARFRKPRPAGKTRPFRRVKRELHERRVTRGTLPVREGLPPFERPLPDRLGWL